MVGGWGLRPAVGEPPAWFKIKSKSNAKRQASCTGTKAGTRGRGDMDRGMVWVFFVILQYEDSVCG